MRVAACMFVCAMMLTAVACAAQEDPVAAWSHFIGEWEGKGSGEPGLSSAGGFSFRPDLDGKILVRRNFAEYAATKDKPAYRHDDLMLTYFDPQSKRWRADYWDSEGHIIHYTAALANSGRSATFISDPAQGSPTYRLTYTAEGEDNLAIKFEIAPPDNSNKFSTYITARATRKAGTKR